jgi:hypothetical protein
MTDTEKKKAQEILEQYDPENLSTDDMDAINSSLKEAGIRPSSDMKTMLEDAGFDAKALGERARETGGAGGPPPGGPPPGGPPPGGGGDQEATASNDQIKQLASILSQYDTNNLSEDDQSSISQKLTELGFSATKSKVSFSV